LSWQIFWRTRGAKISAPPPGSESRPAGLQFLQHLGVGLAVVIGEERDLDGSEALQVDAGADLLQPAQQIGVITERQSRVQAVDDVHFGHRLAGALPELREDLLDRHRVRARHALFQPRERAEQARCFADVGRFEPEVVIEVGARAMTALAFAVGDPAEREQIGRVEEGDAILERQPLRRVDFLRDIRQPGGY
jgi:hypothetical protein